MKVGVVGVGKMGGQIVDKLLAAGVETVVYDVDRLMAEACGERGAVVAESRLDMLARLGEQPIVWLMIPSQFVEAEVAAWVDLLPAGAILIDGGNSPFHDTIRRADMAAQRSIRYIDVGTSGGIRGAEHGFCLMMGGDEATVEALSLIWEALTVPEGRYARVGAVGAGHYVKMIHNGIEYALMQSYAEGYDLLKYGEMSGLDLAVIARVWQGGSIVQSSLNDVIAAVLDENPELDGVEGYVADSGEGRWTYQAAERAQVAMPALREALAVREASQHGHHIFATKLLAAMRNKFGGHPLNRV